MVETNKDNYDTSYRTLKGFHIIGYDGDTDTFSKLHVDEDGHIYTKMLGAYGAGFVELASSVDGYLQNDITDRAARLLGVVSGSMAVTNIAATDKYKLSDTDSSGDPSYYGYLDPAGAWYIMRINSALGTTRYISGSSGYEAAWTGKAALGYDYYNTIF